MATLKGLLTIVAAMALGGCAHPLVISPDFSKIERTDAAVRTQKNVAYYIPENVRTLTVTTAGGGGDSVSYAPYRDIEAAFYKMLSNVYQTVTKLSSVTDADSIKKNDVDVVIVPEITTTSSSPSLLTWPPTKFTVELTARMNDAKGRAIASPKVIGQGQAEFEEFKADFSLAGKRAAQDALIQMQGKLIEINSTPVTEGRTGVNSQATLLENLKSMRDRGLITEQDFGVKEKEILSRQ